MPSSIHALVLVLCWLPTLAWAGQLTLRNGASLPGALVKIDAEHIVWKADLIGEVTVAKSDVTALRADSPVPVTAPGDSEGRSGCRIELQGITSDLDCAGAAPRVVALDTLRTVPPPRSSSGRVTLALDLERGGNDTQKIKTYGTAKWLRPGHRDLFTVSQDYEHNNGDTSNDDADVDYQHDWLRHRGWYWFGRSRYKRDEFNSLTNTFALAAGPGREFTPHPALTLSLQGGPAYMYYKIKGRDWDNNPGAQVQWSAVWDLPWRGVQLSHKGNFGWVFEYSDAYNLDSKTSLTYPLLEHLIAELSVEYDQTGVSSTTDRSDKRNIEWTMSLGYAW
jgi:putative salt-induced outer membrane protein YdiY